MKSWLMLTGLVLFTSGATAASLSPEARGELAPSGRLRVAINYGNPVLATKEPPTGELSGVAVDIGRELGRQTGLPVELIGFETVAQVMAGLKAEAWDVAFLAIDPARADAIAFTAPYMEVENTYLVSESSDLREAADVDRANVRIAVQEKNAADLFLTKALIHASLVRAPDEAGAFGLLKAGSADAMASSRQRLLVFAESNPGYRVLADRFAAIQHAVGVPVRRGAAAAYLRSFIEEIKASGFVQQALEKAGRRGVVVAPPFASSKEGVTP